MSLIDQVRQPEYTGENRCTPCTTVNIAIATGVSILAAVTSTLLGISVFALSLGTIYLRGYLVPGTPALTKRYFPDHVLQWFDKETTTPTSEEPVEINPEQILLNADAVKPCRKDTDLCLTSNFQQAWREHIHTVHTHEPSEDYLAGALSISNTNDQLTINQQGDAFVAYIDDVVLGRWGSQAALIADIAAGTELNERIPNWSELTPTEIVRVLMSLRIFIEQCPNCGGPVQVGEKVVESCCRSYDVIASACQDCDARLFEMEWEGAVADGTSEYPNQPVQTTS